MKKNHVRRGLAGLIAVGTLCAAMPALSFSAAEQTLAGDVNLDNAVTTDDIVTLQNYLLGNAGVNSTAFANADLTADGAVNAFDLAMLKKTIAVDPIANEVSIYLSDSGITVEGDKNGVVQITGNVAKITGSGLYHVYGTITEGQLYVETAAEDLADVELELNDVTMTNSTMSCIYTSAASGSEKTKITLNGTNTLTDTAAAAYAESGVIYTNNKLTITKSSTGTLNVNSNMNTGIYADKKMNLNGGTIVVNTADGSATADADAIVGDNNIEIEGAVIDIDSSADGIKSKDQGVYLLNGTVTVKAGNDAVQACTEIAVSGGTLTAGGDRGFRLDEAGALNITGGKVIATATDYQLTGAGTSVVTTGSTQPVMMLDMAAEWTKDNVVTITDQGGNALCEYQPIKKYSYVLISDAALSASGTYNVYVAGTQMTHSTSAAGEFTNTAAATEFYTVQALAGGSTITTGTISTITYSSTGVTLYDAAGNTVSADDTIAVDGSTVTIKKAGEYEVNGSSSNGRIVVSTDDTAEPTAIVQLNLTGLELSNSTMAPIYVENVGDECVIAAKSGSVNTISDGTSHTDTYVNSDGETVTIDSAIIARDDLKIKGQGTLTVNGNTADGIVCKNDLKLWNGTINVTAVDDAIRGNGSVKIGDADDTDYSTLKVTATATNGDGIKSGSTETGEGIVLLTGGTVNVTSYGDAIHGAQELTVNGGTITLTTTCPSTSSGGSSSGGSWGPGGMGGMGSESTPSTAVSAKGLKASETDDTTGVSVEGTVTINGGTISINATDDAIHGTNITMTGGDVTASSSGDGLHADGLLTIDNGTLDIPTSYEGIEGDDIVVNGGDIHCFATNDCFNASGDSIDRLTINGGYIYLIGTNGDGVDSNGDIYINGGTLIQCGPTGGGNGIFDNGDGGYQFSITGGTVIGIGTSDMMVSPSVQNGTYLSSSGASLQSGNLISAADSSGNVIAVLTVPSELNMSGAVQFYSDRATSSTALYSGGTFSGTMNADGYAESGTISGGTQLSAGGSSSTRPW